MLAHNLRRWPDIKPALLQRLVFAGLHLPWPPHVTSLVSPRNILREASYYLDAKQNGQDHDLLEGNDWVITLDRGLTHML